MRSRDLAVSGVTWHKDDLLLGEPGYTVTDSSDKLTSSLSINNVRIGTGVLVAVSRGLFYVNLTRKHLVTMVKLVTTVTIVTS